MGNPSDFSDAAALPTPFDKVSSLFRVQSTHSVNTTQSQSPPSYTHPTLSSARTPSHSNIASQLNAGPSPAKPGTAGPKHKRALTVRWLSIVVGIFGIIFFACAMSKEDDVESYDDGLGSMADSLGIIMLGSTTSVSSIMLIADLILLYRKKYPMHPAIPVTFDLLTWLGLASMSSMLCILTGWSNDASCDDTQPGEECWATYVLNLRRTGFAMMWLALILHFTIFVMACRAVHRRRKEDKEAKAMLRAYMEMA